MFFARDESTFFDTYEMIKISELQKMSCRRGLYKIFFVLRPGPWPGTRLNLPLIAVV